MTDDEYADKIYELLSGRFGPTGITTWWNRPRWTSLGGRTPQQAWKDGERQILLDIAYSIAYGEMA